MEKARELLSAGDRETGSVSGLEVRPHHAGHASSFYEGFALRGIRVDKIQRGSLTCTFTVPPRFTDGDGNLTPGAIANLVDEVGGTVTIADGQHTKVSVDMSISYMAAVRLHDELEITAKVLGHKAGYSGTYVLLKNKATGEVVAEGRHSLFGPNPPRTWISSSLLPRGDPAPMPKRLKLEEAGYLVKRSLEFIPVSPRQDEGNGDVFGDDPPLALGRA